GYGTLASDQGDVRYDNSSLIEQLLDYRAQEAALLGFVNFAQLRLQSRMADTADEVLAFLRELAAKAKPYAQRDFQELRDFARTQYGMTQLEPSDLPYLSERLREQRYANSEDEVKQYFTEPQVLRGLFDTAGRLVEVELTPYETPLWHQDARALPVSVAGRTVGYLFIDLYARQGKQSGAWVDSERN